MVEEKVKQIIHRFVDILVKKGIRVDQVILYGSYASGDMKLYSDIDLAIKRGRGSGHGNTLI